jgi:hypothetical protein
VDGATVSVAVVASRTEAEPIVGMLRSHGVSAAVSAADAGGQYPQMQLEGVRVLVASDEPRPVGSSLPPMTPLDEPVDQMEAQGRTRVPTRDSQVGDRRAPRRRPARGTGRCHRATIGTSTSGYPRAGSTWSTPAAFLGKMPAQDAEIVTRLVDGRP